MDLLFNWSAIIFAIMAPFNGGFIAAIFSEIQTVRQSSALCKRNHVSSGAEDIFSLEWFQS